MARSLQYEIRFYGIMRDMQYAKQRLKKKLNPIQRSTWYVLYIRVLSPFQKRHRLVRSTWYVLYLFASGDIKGVVKCGTAVAIRP